MNEPAKITCKKISFEPAEALLKSEGKDIKDYETVNFRLSWFKTEEGKFSSNLIIDHNSYGWDEDKLDYIKNDIMTCLDERYLHMLNLAKLVAEKFSIEYLASMKYITEANFPLIEATGLRPRPKPEVKTKTEPPPILTLPSKEEQNG